MGFLALVGRGTTAALACGAVGIVALLAGIWRASRAVQRRTYRRRRLQAADWLLIATVALSPLALALLNAAGNDALTWYASPVTWPQFDPVVALALVPLLAPLVRLPADRPAREQLPEIDLAVTA